MKYTEALTALIDHVYAESEHCHAHTPGFPGPTRDEIATGDTNIRISAILIGQLADDDLFDVPGVEYGVFDNCREYGLTVAVGGWTFCVYEHRNSDAICIEGCPDADVQPHGPYGGEDKYDVLAQFHVGEYGAAGLTLTWMLDAVRSNPAATRADVKAVVR